MPLTLKAARVNVNLKQEFVAEKLGVSKDTIRNWERGKSYPDAVQLGTILTLYGVSYDDIIFLPKTTL